MYTAEPAVNGEGGIDNLHQRFREEEVAIFEKHGAEVVAVWRRLDEIRNAGLDAGLSRSGPPPGSLGSVCRGSRLACAAEKYAVPLSAEAYMMSATDYSKLK